MLPHWAQSPLVTQNGPGRSSCKAPSFEGILLKILTCHTNAGLAPARVEPLRLTLEAALALPAFGAARGELQSILPDLQVVAGIII